MPLAFNSTFRVELNAFSLFASRASSRALFFNFMDIRFDGVRKTFEGSSGLVTALDGIDLRIGGGEFVCFVGPSGCGKSTLCNMLAGFEKPTSGSVTLDGEEVNGPSIQRAMMFQEPALFPWLTVEGNVRFGLKSLKLSKAQQSETVARFLKMVHLSQFGKAQPHELSGGMKQRVALARALAVDPRVLLMDEPFAALDAQTRDHLHIELQQIWRETRKTIVFVTHNVREAVTLATRVVVFTARPGRVKREFDLEDLDYPRRVTETRVAETIARIQNTLRDEVAQAEAGEYDSHDDDSASQNPLLDRTHIVSTRAPGSTQTRQNFAASTRDSAAQPRAASGRFAR
jgi:NitT/TauT family transport system ATP-binding protein